jgi:uncharacterized repeat protein (TIGR01451 family)
MGILFALSLLVSILFGHGLYESTSVQAQPAPTQIQNQAQASYVPDGAVDPILLPPAVTTVLVAPPAPPALRIVKTVDRTTATPGEVAGYQIVVTNVSTTTANPVTITDQLPRGLIYVDNSIQALPNPPTQVTNTGSTFTLTFGALAPGQAITVNYQVRVTPDAVNGNGVNTAQASAPGAPTVTATAQIAITPPPPPLLQIVKTVDRTTVVPGDVATYQVVVTNVSTTVANPVTVTDQLPRGFVYVDNSVQATPTQPTQVVNTGSTLTFAFGALAPGQSITVTYRVQVTPDAVNGNGLNTAQASTPGIPPITSTAQVTTGAPPPALPQLQIVKTPNRTAATPGEVVAYQVVVTNTSNVVANPVTIADQLPQGFVYVDNSVQATPAQPTQVANTGSVLIFSFGALAPGQSITVNYQVRVTPEAVNGNGLNTAQASTPGVPPITAIARVVPNPPPPPQLQLVKTVARQSVAPGEVVDYRLVVTNVSTVTANPVTVTDQLPVGLVYVQGSIQATPNPPTEVVATDSRFTLTFATLPPGQAITVNYQVRVTPDAVRGNGINTAQVQAPGIPPIAAEATVAISSPPRLQIVKTSDRAAAEPGDVVVYRLVVTNVSNVVADPVTITDQLPRGLAYVPNSVQATPNPPTQITTTDSTLNLTFGALQPGQSISVAYAVLMTPDSVRGDGRNVAQASAPGAVPVVATYQITVRPGILADCGTLLGRVFVDKNFDGQQQPGEPGVPNAVIFMDDGNRILTDADGLFSLINVLPGYRVGTLDLYSLPGYTLAPNLYRIEENSVSRMARLSPGGLARMNFAVTPTFGEEQP